MEKVSCHLDKLNHWAFADTTGSLVDKLGIRSDEGVALRATFIIDPHNVIQHVSINNLDVGRNPKDTLRILDALQTMNYALQQTGWWRYFIVNNVEDIKNLIPDFAKDSFEFFFNYYELSL